MPSRPKIFIPPMPTKKAPLPPMPTKKAPLPPIHAPLSHMTTKTLSNNEINLNYINEIMKYRNTRPNTISEKINKEDINNQENARLQKILTPYWSNKKPSNYSNSSNS